MKVEKQTFKNYITLLSIKKNEYEDEYERQIENCSLHDSKKISLFK